MASKNLAELINELIEDVESDLFSKMAPALHEAADVLHDEGFCISSLRVNFADTTGLLDPSQRTAPVSIDIELSPPVRGLLSLDRRIQQ
jgi:hypothetical protein